MPWNDNDGGWKGGGNRGPWGQGPSGGQGTPPDLEEMLKKGQDRLKQLMPGGSLGARGLIIIVLVAVGLWAASGFYTVEPDEQGVVLRFGKFVQLTQPGLNYRLPFPIESSVTPKVTKVNRVEVGMRGGLQDGPGRGSAVRDVPEESLMLTGDENIVDVDFTVFWVIKNAADYLFNVQNPEGTVKSVAESAMREVVGTSEIQPILTGEKLKTEVDVQELMQKVLDSYVAGIQVTQVQLQKVDPPGAVIDSFRDVQAARADQERLGNEAEAYANKVVPEARGAAARIIQAAEGYRAGIVDAAVGQAARFESIYGEYVKAPEVTRQRMYFETMEKVFAGMDKIIIDQKDGGQGVVPYLPLNDLSKASSQGAN
ncbi:MAG: FtsH protease activity modulator HflK [Hyphomicrobiales bacterium]